MWPPPGVVLLPSIDLLAGNELRRPETTVFFANALLLATRSMMSSGAMTCPIRHRVS